MGLDEPGVTALVYRKGELQPNMVDLGWPHQIGVLAPRGHVKNCTEIHELVRDNGLSLCEHGHTYGNLVNFYIVYCFAQAEHAAIFQARFGGVPFNRKEWRKRELAEREAAGWPAGLR